MQALRGFLRNFIRWAAWNPMRMKVLHQDCMRMLRTRFVLLVESSMIRRYSITRHSWMTSTVFPAALARSRAVFVSLQTSQFECLGECVKTLWLPIGLLVPGLVDLAAKTERSADSSSALTLTSSGISSSGSTTGRSTTTSCESRSSPERPSLKG